MKNATSGEAAPSPRRKVLLCFVACVVFVCLAYGYFFLVFATTSTAELAECGWIAKAVEAENIIPVSTSSPSSPALFCDVGIRHHFLLRFYDIKIYGVIDEDRQDAIVGTLKRYRQQPQTRPLLVQFYEKENWQTWSNPSTGAHGGRRGPEVPIRVISVH